MTTAQQIVNDAIKFLERRLARKGMPQPYRSLVDKAWEGAGTYLVHKIYSPDVFEPTSVFGDDRWYSFYPSEDGEFHTLLIPHITDSGSEGLMPVFDLDSAHHGKSCKEFAPACWDGAYGLEKLQREEAERDLNRVKKLAPLVSKLRLGQTNTLNLTTGGSVKIIPNVLEYAGGGDFYMYWNTCRNSMEMYWKEKEGYVDRFYIKWHGNVKKIS